MSSKGNAKGSGQSENSNTSSGSNQGNTGRSSQTGGQRTTSGWQAGYLRAYEDAANNIDNGEFWGFGGGSDSFGEGYMRGWQEIYGDKGPDF